jgi:carbamoyltransferase
VKIISLITSEESSAAFYDTSNRNLLAASEERFTRIKNFAGFPFRTLEWIFNETNLDPSEIDAYIYSHSDSVLPDTLETCSGEFVNLIEQLESPRKEEVASLIVKRLCAESAYNERHLQKAYQEIKKLDNNAIFIAKDHHECHAYSVLPFSNTNHFSSNSLFFTLDGKGNHCSGSFWVYDEENIKLKCIYRIPSFISLGYFYGNATASLGFKPHRHEGKVTGLAALGNIVRDSPLFNIFVFKEGRISLNPEHIGTLYSPFFVSAAENNPQLKQLAVLLEEYGRNDFAATVQEVLIRTTTRLLESVCKRNNLIDVDLYCAGGIFANVSLNKALREHELVRQISVTPAMGDSGLVVGGISSYLQGVSNK